MGSMVSGSQQYRCQRRGVLGLTVSGRAAVVGLAQVCVVIHVVGGRVHCKGVDIGGIGAGDERVHQAVAVGDQEAHGVIASALRHVQAYRALSCSTKELLVSCESWSTMLALKLRCQQDVDLCVQQTITDASTARQTMSSEEMGWLVKI